MSLLSTVSARRAARGRGRKHALFWGCGFKAPAQTRRGPSHAAQAVGSHTHNLSASACGSICVRGSLARVSKRLASAPFFVPAGLGP